MSLYPYVGGSENIAASDEHDVHVNLLCSKLTFVNFEHNEILSC